jgi:hypothetical protein
VAYFVLQVAAYGSNIYRAFDWPNAYPRNPFSPYSLAPNLAASSLAYGYLEVTGLMKPTAEMMKSLNYSLSSARSSPEKNNLSAGQVSDPLQKTSQATSKGAAKYGEASSSAETKEGNAFQVPLRIQRHVKTSERHRI